MPAGINIGGYGGARILKKKASDSWIALSVIACSVVLFVALAFGLAGKVLVRDGHSVRVKFHDVTGVKVSSQVKYAGAPAGSVSQIRMLTTEEQKANPDYLAEVTLHLLPDVPPLTKKAKVSIAADTLLSDKFVLIHDENTGVPLLENGEVIGGISPTTFDKLARRVDQVIDGVWKTVGGDSTGADAKDLFSKVNGVVESTQSILDEIGPVVKEARSVVSDAHEAVKEARITIAEARTVLSDNKQPLSRAITRLDAAASSIETLARRGDTLLRDNSSNITGALSNFRVSSENFKVTSTYSKVFLKDLCERPSRLIWGGGKPPVLPDQQKIPDSRQPVPKR